jgi:hypothetical protein
MMSRIRTLSSLEARLRDVGLDLCHWGGLEDSVEDYELDDPNGPEGKGVCAKDDHSARQVVKIMSVAKFSGERSRQQSKDDAAYGHDPEGHDFPPQVRSARLTPYPFAVEEVIDEARHNIGEERARHLGPKLQNAIDHR